MNATRGIQEQSLLLYILLIGLAVLVVPYLARTVSGNPSLIGEQPYLHARMSEYAMSGTAEDDLMLGGRTFRYTPYHYLLGILGRVAGMRKASMVLPATLGLISLFLSYLLLKGFKVEPMSRFLILLSLILSPAFIYTFTVSNPHALAIMLTLLGFVLFLRDERRSHPLSVLAFGLASTASLFNMLLIFSLLLAYCLATRTRKNKAFVIIFALLVIAALRPAPFITKYETMQGDIVREAISDLGGKIGFGIFYIILAVMGLFASWKRKRSYAGAYLLIAALLAGYPLLGSASSMYLNFLLTYFVGLGLLRLQTARWEFQVIRNLTLLIIICGLLFSSVSYINRLSHAPPSRELMDGIAWLSEHSLGDEVVLSYHGYGYIIEQEARRKVVIDSLFSATPDIDHRLIDIQDLFYTVNLEEARGVLTRYGIGYILIDKEMEERLVWDEPEQGLLYLLRNNETFKNTYTTEGVRIWKVV